MIHNLLGEMMDIHHKTVIAETHQPSDGMVYQRHTTHRHQSLRHRVCQWFQSGSQTCGKDHRLFHKYLCLSRLQNYTKKMKRRTNEHKKNRFETAQIYFYRV